VAEDRYCRSCGQELESEDQFCGSCGRPVHATAHVPTPEADVPVPPPPQVEDNPVPPGSGRAQTAPWGPVWGMVAVFLVLWVGVTIQERPSDPPGKDLGDQIGYQIGAGIVPALRVTTRVGAVLVALGGVYHLTYRKQGVTFREAVFNWPMVVLAVIVTFVSLL